MTPPNRPAIIEAVVTAPGPYSIGSGHLPGLSKLVEELGELGQVLGKYLGAGGHPHHWDGSNLDRRAEAEMGDVLAAIQFFVEANPDRFAPNVVEARAIEKLDLFRLWHENPEAVP